MLTAEPPAVRDASSSYQEFRNDQEAGLHGVRASAAFWRYLTIGNPNPAEALDRDEWRTLSRATGPAGGYLAPSDFDTQITTAARAVNVMPDLCREVVTDNGHDLPLPAGTAHGTSSWTAENATVAPSDDAFAQATLGALKAQTATIASEELATDATLAFDQYLADELGGRIGQLEESAYVAGTGSGQPQGVFATGTGIATVTATTGSAALYTAADVTAIYKALPAAYRNRATWLIAADEYANLVASLTTSGALAFPSLQAESPTLFSRPVAITAYAPAPTAAAKTIAFGDFKTGMTIRRVRGVYVQVQLELHADNGQRGYRAYRRSDSRVVVPDAIRLLQHSAT